MLPEHYWAHCSEPIRFEKAVMYYLNPITVPVPFYDATGGPFNTAPVDCWVELYDQDGNVGQAPCGPIMASRLLPLLLTGETMSYEEWYRKCYWAIRNNGFSGETANELGRLDLALHDLLAKRAGMPLHRFLGAKRDWVKVYASACGTNLTYAQTEAELRAFLDMGYDCFKMKAATNFGTQLDRDVERIRFIREMIGPDKQLAVDVNQLWNAEDAMAFFDRISQFDIAWYEEPVHSHNFRELDKLTKLCPVPVGMGESVKNIYMLEEYVHCGVGQLQPIPTNLCAVRDWVKARDLAQAHNIHFTSGGISQLTASYAATCREEDMVEYLYPIMNPLNEFMKNRPEEKNGMFLLSSDPGANFVPDFKQMEKKNILAHVDYIRAQ